MASVIQRGGTYYVRWKDATGRWRKQVSSSTTKRDAQRYADDLERKAERQSKGVEPIMVVIIGTLPSALHGSAAVGYQQLAVALRDCLRRAIDAAYPREGSSGTKRGTRCDR
jgi:hypothetical protein